VTRKLEDYVRSIVAYQLGNARCSLASSLSCSQCDDLEKDLERDSKLDPFDVCIRCVLTSGD